MPYTGTAEEIRARAKSYYQKNKETIKERVRLARLAKLADPEKRAVFLAKEHARHKIYEAAHSKEIVAKKKMYRHANWARNKARYIRQFYKLTFPQWEQMLIGQLGRCSMCDLPMMGQRDPVIDHDHDCCPGTKSCGKCVRGLAHHSCNIVLGLMKEDPDLLYTLAEAARLLRKRKLQLVAGQ